MTHFQVTSERFNGPIEVLLQMIERRKLPVNDISLSEITDDYIRFVSEMNSESLSNATHFIFVASTLTLIKSKSLLPSLELTHEEEGDIEELKRRLEILKVFTESGKELKSLFLKQPAFFYPRPRKRLIDFDPHESLQVENLSAALLSALQSAPEKEVKKKEASVRVAVHIEDMMTSLEDRITAAIKTDFNSFINQQAGERPSKEVRVYKVVGFLAMLELVKKGALHVIQDKNFSNIHLEQS